MNVNVDSMARETAAAAHITMHFLSLVLMYNKNPTSLCVPVLSKQ